MNPTDISTDNRPFPLRLVVSGLLIVLLVVGGGSLWSALAPLEGAVVSPGIISVASFRKQIQHLEGGIVDSILVDDGDRVEQGQLLIQLRDVQPEAELRQLERQYLEAQAVVARLLAERDEAEQIVFPQDLLAGRDNPSVKSVVDGQQNILASRRTLIEDQRSVLKHQIAQAEEEIVGLSAQLAAKNRQQALIREELASVEKALAKKMVPRTMSLKLQQELAETDGEMSGYRAEMGRLEESILEIRLQISEADAQYVADITEQLRTHRTRLFDLSQRIVAARDVLQRTRVVSPIDGIVVNLQVHTEDGVIAPGEAILEVVPTDDELVVNAFVDPDDIDEVRAGMAADVRLTSISRRRRIPLEGVVSDISADRLTDPQTGKDYFRARIELSPSIAEPAKPLLVAGMGVDVFIKTGARTPLDYLLSPLTNSLQTGMREN